MTERHPELDVIVIGAGIHGCSTALHLARRGVKVIVLEKDYAGRHSSGVGLLYRASSRQSDTQTQDRFDILE